MLSLFFCGVFLTLSALVHAFEPTCPLIFDGRVPPNAELVDFDRAQTPFGGLRGRDIKWSSILTFPSIQPSVFDYEFGGKPIEVKIDENSILRPSGTGAQTGYRRAELIFVNNTGSDASTSGVVTYHWSVFQPKDQPLNVTHEYVPVFHERKNGEGHHFQFVAGTIVGKEKIYSSRNWKVLDRGRHVIWQTRMLFNEWENFAITLDYPQKTIQVHYSTGQNSLQPVTPPEDNENDQGGLFQVGLLKKSIGAKVPTKDGYHPPKFRDVLVYGGIFIENSANGCISR